MATAHRGSVVVLYNYVGEDVYETIRKVDASKLSFKPEYDLDVSTVEEEYAAIARALRRVGFRARTVNLKEDIRRLERVLKRNKPDVIFNLVEHFRDDSALEPHVASMFELYGVAYTGAPPFALTVCRRKGLTKEILVATDVPTPQFRLLEYPEMPEHHGLHFPLIVKPAREDASAGVDKGSVVDDEAALAVRLEKVYDDYGAPMLVEEFVEGRELHVAVIGNDPPEVLPPIEFDFSRLPEDHPHIISYDAKWNPLDEVFHRVDTVCPADVSADVMEDIEEVTLRAYEVTGCRDYARLDVRLGVDDQPFVLEVNPNPDLTEGVSLMESAEVAGYSFEECLEMIVEFALERGEEPVEEVKSVPEVEVPPELLAAERTPDPAQEVAEP